MSHTDITITNCLFNGFNIAGALIWQIKEGKIIVGTKNNGNVFENIYAYNKNISIPGYGTLGIWSNVNVEISIVSNTFNIPTNAAPNNFGLVLWSAPSPKYLEQVPQTKVTPCEIEQNVFNLVNTTLIGIELGDRRLAFYPNDLPMLVEMKNNLFNMSDDAYIGIACWAMSGTIIRNNRFTGNGKYGVIISYDLSADSKNGLMLGNNFNNTTFSVTPVLLDVRTNNWTIVGSGLGEIILDLGVGNIITGMNVNTSEEPLGQTIVDNLREWKDN